MPAISESAHLSEHCNLISRRQALAGAAACGALALPAGAAIAAQLPCNVDPHLAWLREIIEIRNATDPAIGASDDRIDRIGELENLIATTPPTTMQGALAIASMIVSGHEWVYPDPEQLAFLEPEDRAGHTLARYLLENTPPDVLRRAGVEAAA